MNIAFIDLKKQYQAYKGEINLAVSEVMSHAEFILGKDVNLLESELENYTSAKYAITCANGTDALQLALMAIDIKPGEEIITPSFTFIATAEAGALLGAKVVLCDVRKKDYNIDVDQLAEKITSKTRAIIPVSVYGQTSDMDEINIIAEQYGQKLGHKIYVIEDAAQSFGATYKNKKSCNLSDIATTSFFPSKPLGCYGDGGALFTNDEKIAKRLKSLRGHGQVGRYNHEYIGVNSRLDTLQAAILRVKLKHLDSELRKREELAALYQNMLQDTDCILPKVMPSCTHVYAQYCLRIKHRDEMANKLKELGVPTAIHYPKPIHEQPCFKELGYKSDSFPVSTEMAKEIISLPMSAFLTKEQVVYIVESLKKSLV